MGNRKFKNKEIYSLHKYKCVQLQKNFNGGY